MSVSSSEGILLVFPGAEAHAGGAIICCIFFFFCAGCTSSKPRLCSMTEVHLCDELKSLMKLKWTSTQAEEIEGASHSFLSYILFFLIKTRLRCLLLKLTFLSLLNLLSHLPFLNMIDCCLLKTATELFGSLRSWIVLLWQEQLARASERLIQWGFMGLC